MLQRVENHTTSDDLLYPLTKRKVMVFCKKLAVIFCFLQGYLTITAAFS